MWSQRWSFSDVVSWCSSVLTPNLPLSHVEVELRLFLALKVGQDFNISTLALKSCLLQRSQLKLRSGSSWDKRPSWNPLPWPTHRSQVTELPMLVASCSSSDTPQVPQCLETLSPSPIPKFLSPGDAARSTRDKVPLCRAMLRRWILVRDTNVMGWGCSTAGGLKSSGLSIPTSQVSPRADGNHCCGEHNRSHSWGGHSSASSSLPSSPPPPSHSDMV